MMMMMMNDVLLASAKGLAVAYTKKGDSETLLQQAPSEFYAMQYEYDRSKSG